MKRIKLDIKEIKQMDEFKLICMLLETQRQYRKDNDLRPYSLSLTKQETFACLMVNGILENGRDMKELDIKEIEQMDEFQLLCSLLETLRQYRKDNGIYTTHEGRIKQETFAHLMVKGILDKGLYRK